MGGESFDMTTRLDALERDLKSMAEVVAAVADDTLRVCILLQELSQAGVFPPLPWTLATHAVELHHALLAQSRGEVPGNGGPYGPTN